MSVVWFPKYRAKVANINNRWTVLVWSRTVGDFIPQGEWLTEAEAREDLKNWQV
jgi:hypothetical protein